MLFFVIALFIYAALMLPTWVKWSYLERAAEVSRGLYNLIQTRVTLFTCWSRVLTMWLTRPLQECNNRSRSALSMKLCLIFLLSRSCKTILATALFLKKATLRLRRHSQIRKQPAPRVPFQERQNACSRLLPWRHPVNGCGRVYVTWPEKW